MILSRGTGTYCNAYTPSLRMRGVDFQTASNEQEAAGLSFSKFQTIRESAGTACLHGVQWRNQWQTDDPMSTGDLLCGSYDPAKRSMALRLHL